jgi:hypothetical protein
MLGYPPPEFEHQRNGPLPQYFSDEFGWEDVAHQTAAAFHRLPPEDQAKAVIFANNYGEAAAIDFFGSRYGLPKAISIHQNYWLWGPGKLRGMWCWSSAAMGPATVIASAASKLRDESSIPIHVLMSITPSGCAEPSGSI